MFGRAQRKEDVEFRMRLSFLGTKVTNSMLFLQLWKEIKGLTKTRLHQDLNGTFQTILQLKFKNVQSHSQTITLLVHFALIQLAIKQMITSSMMRTFIDGARLHHRPPLQVLLMKHCMIGFGRTQPKNQETLNKIGKTSNGLIKTAIYSLHFQLD